MRTLLTMGQLLRKIVRSIDDKNGLIIKYLLAYGANPYLQDRNGRTPLELCTVIEDADCSALQRWPNDCDAILKEVKMDLDGRVGWLQKMNEKGKRKKGIIIRELLSDCNNAKLEGEKQSDENLFFEKITRANMRAISTALGSYQVDHNEFPKQLIEDDLNRTILPSEYYYPKEIPTDGWGIPFKYWSDGTDYRLTSYGRDKVKGGNGLDADIVISKGLFITP